MDRDGNPWRSIAELRSRTLAEEYALVLSAADIGWRIDEETGGWELRVADADVERAAAALAAYGAERPGVPQVAPLPDHPDGAITGLIAAALLVVFFLAGGLGWWPVPDWTREGSANAARIAAGEWWRVVTALTLHNDLSHVIGNGVAMALFAASVCRWFGPGLGLWLILAAGAGGNTLNAIVRGGAHSAVGASTAVFGAVGILAGLQLSRRLATGERGLMRIRTWAPLGAGLGLLALLGSSASSDLGAHLFGFASGGVLGWLASRLHAERLAGWPQAALALAAVAAILGCWSLAL